MLHGLLLPDGRGFSCWGSVLHRRRMLCARGRRERGRRMRMRVCRWSGDNSGRLAPGSVECSRVHPHCDRHITQPKATAANELLCVKNAFSLYRVPPKLEFVPAALCQCDCRSGPGLRSLHIHTMGGKKEATTTVYWPWQRPANFTS